MNGVDNIFIAVGATSSLITHYFIALALASQLATIGTGPHHWHDMICNPPPDALQRMSSEEFTEAWRTKVSCRLCRLHHAAFRLSGSS